MPQASTWRRASSEPISGRRSSRSSRVRGAVWTMAREVWVILGATLARVSGVESERIGCQRIEGSDKRIEGGSGTSSLPDFVSIIRFLAVPSDPVDSPGRDDDQACE